MEWWEYTNEDFVTRGNRPSLGSYTDFKLGNTGKKLRITDKGLAAGAVGGALAFGAQKLIKNMRKDKETEKPDMNEAKESWYNDPGAQQIMEAYFSEFPDADIY